MLRSTTSFLRRNEDRDTVIRVGSDANVGDDVMEVAAATHRMRTSSEEMDDIAASTPMFSESRRGDGGSGGGKKHKKSKKKHKKKKHKKRSSEMEMELARPNSVHNLNDSALNGSGFGTGDSDVERGSRRGSGSSRGDTGVEIVSATGEARYRVHSSRSTKRGGVGSGSGGNSGGSSGGATKPLRGTLNVKPHSPPRIAKQPNWADMGFSGKSDNGAGAGYPAPNMNGSGGGSRIGPASRTVPLLVCIIVLLIAAVAVLVILLLAGSTTECSSSVAAAGTLGSGAACFTASQCAGTSACIRGECSLVDCILDADCSDSACSRCSAGVCRYCGTTPTGNCRC